MPMWNIYHTQGIFSAQEKKQLASRITDHYHEVGLPRFYVVTAFHEVAAENLYIGGEENPLAVRVVIDHIARRLPEEADRRRAARWVSEILRPFVDKHDGLHWEFHVDETSPDLWMINGLVPPPPDSHAERAWVTSNTPSPY